MKLAIDQLKEMLEQAELNQEDAEQARSRALTRSCDVDALLVDATVCSLCSCTDIDSLDANRVLCLDCHAQGIIDFDNLSCRWVAQS